MLATGLASAILLGYGFSLWWLLRRESPAALAGLLALLAFALLPRLFFANDYPEGVNEDEVKQVYFGAGALWRGNLFAPCVQAPCLLSALFQAPLLPILGATRWPIRLYSLITGTLAVPLTFVVARAVGMRLAASFAAGVFVAVLPWSVLYSRVSIGGELVFHQLLVLAALARLVWWQGAGAEVAIASLGLTLLLYDYACGWAMVAMPVVAAALASGHRRLLCLMALPIAALGWWPYLIDTPDQALPGVRLTGFEDFAAAADPLHLLWVKTDNVLNALTAPIAGDWWLSVRAGAVHPTLVLLIAVLGLLAAPRRTFFLVAGFAAGLAPAIVSCCGEVPSTHRMLMAFPFIALAAGSALDIPPSAWLRAAAWAIVIPIVAVQSLTFYFSNRFWSPESNGTFDSNTAMVESLPQTPSPPVIATEQSGHLFALRQVNRLEDQALRVENWLPPNGPSIYAFGSAAVALRPFYEALFGAERVRPFNLAFLVTLEDADWSWVRAHGWAHEADCDGRVRKGQVPVLYHSYVTFQRLSCRSTIKQRWHGRWLRSRTRMRLWFSGRAVVSANGKRIAEHEGVPSNVEFDLDSGKAISVSITTEPGIDLNAALLEVTPAGDRVPMWQSVVPLFEPRSSPSR
jgi:hypothetical protein